MSSGFGYHVKFNETNYPFEVTSGVYGYDFKFNDDTMNFTVSQNDLNNSIVTDLNIDQIKAFDDFRKYAKNKWPGTIQ